MSEFSEAFIAVLDYVEGQGVTSLKDVEGCWENAVDEHWWIALNGSTEPTMCSQYFLVHAFSCYIEFNGCPAGQVNAFGGWIAAGELANEDNFIDAVKAATVKA